jgi:hypothetical protein
MRYPFHLERRNEILSADQDEIQRDKISIAGGILPTGLRQQRIKA